MMISTILNRNRIEKIASVVFALIVWQASAMLIGESLLLVTPIAVVKRLLVSLQRLIFFYLNRVFFSAHCGRLSHWARCRKLNGCYCRQISPCRDYVLALYSHNKVCAGGIFHYFMSYLA